MARPASPTGAPLCVTPRMQTSARRRHPVTSRREVRAKDELAFETTGLKTAVCLGDLIEGDPLRDARSDGASCQQTEEPPQVLAEPGRMSRPHHVD